MPGGQVRSAVGIQIEYMLQDIAGAAAAVVVAAAAAVVAEAAVAVVGQK